jgi:DNA-binding protein
LTETEETVTIPKKVLNYVLEELKQIREELKKRKAED